MSTQADGLTAPERDGDWLAEPSSQGPQAAPSRGRILLVDEEPAACAALEDVLCDEGYEVATAGNAFRGLDLLARVRPDVVLSELRLPGLDGLAFMERVRVVSPTTRIVIMTAFGSVGAAVDAMKRGADDFLEKPIDMEALCRTLHRSMERASCLGQVHAAVEPSTGDAATFGVVGHHPLMRAALYRAEQVAPTRATILLTGETGTGKSLLAETIHHMSRRAQGPFVEVSCGALSETLLDSELFGHEKGAFTGATSRHDGRFMRAAGGTLFLDEIGSCPLAMQVKLLRFLQTRRFERVGGRKTLSVDVRLIAATNSDLEAEVARGRFREDLYYRLNVVPIQLPPLRDRSSDIPALAATFLARFAAENQRQLDGFSREALERLLIHRWPGNVRELEHAIEHAGVMARGRLVMPYDLPESVVRPPPDPLDVTIPGSTLAEIERAAILKSLMAVGGSATEAAAMLGISKSKIYYRLRDYGCEPSYLDGGSRNGVTADRSGPRDRRRSS
jgi:DNA-binding NtrC family response regulator